MNKQNRALTPIEYRYVKKQMAETRSLMKNLNLWYLFMVFMGILVIYLLGPISSIAPGVLLVVVGLAGFIYYTLHSDPIKFGIENETVWLKGVINFQFVGEGKYQFLCPFLSDKRLMCPEVVHSCFKAVVDKYEQEAIWTEVAICRYSRENEKETYYIPLRVADEICIQGALNKYGIRYYLLPSTLWTLKVLVGTLFVAVLSIPVHVFSKLFGRSLEDIIFVITIIPTFLGGIWIAFKLLPDEEPIIKHRVSCTFDPS